MIIKGTVAEGLRESSHFTSLPWVREQFIARLGIDPYPGTLNLAVAGADLEKLKQLKRRKGIEIAPEPGFCAAQSYPVLVGGRIKGALIVPLVPGYPESKMEIIAAEKLIDVLNLKSGDKVEMEMLSF